MIIEMPEAYSKHKCHDSQNKGNCESLLICRFFLYCPNDHYDCPIGQQKSHHRREERDKEIRFHNKEDTRDYLDDACKQVCGASFLFVFLCKKQEYKGQKQYWYTRLFLLILNRDKLN